VKAFRDEAQLAEAIRGRIAGHHRALIGVDGAYGSGKSTVAEKIAADLGGIAFEIDRYTQQNGQPYQQQLRYADIQSDLGTLCAQDKPLILDGACLLHVLNQIGVTADVLVYVKRLDDSGIWHDEDTCDPAWINLSSPMLNMPGAELDREVAGYHLEHDPLDKADLHFLRIEIAQGA
jgi:hypothetical protein